MTLILTDLIKIMTGMPRPYFLSICKVRSDLVTTMNSVMSYASSHVAETLFMEIEPLSLNIMKCHFQTFVVLNSVFFLNFNKAKVE